MKKINSTQVQASHSAMQAKQAGEAARQAPIQAKKAASVAAIRSAAIGGAAEQIADRIGQALLDEVDAGRHPYPGVARTTKAPAPSGGRYEASAALQGAAGFHMEIDEVPAWKALKTDTPPSKQEQAQLYNAVADSLSERGFELMGLDVTVSGFRDEQVGVAAYLRDPEFDKKFGVGTKLGEFFNRMFVGGRTQRLHTPQLHFPTGSSDSFAYADSIR